MPQTRRQQAVPKSKSYHPIPPKHDTSLFQKSGNCIEGLPLSIFLIIKDFLSIEDYRDLMNCNLATFQPIKYETVYYDLIGPERWSYMESVHEEKREEFVVNVIGSVKNRSKQIAMTMNRIPASLMMQHAHVFAGIHRVRVSCNQRPHKETIDFNIFNNIHEVYLEYFQVDEILGGFENVVHLVISGFAMLRKIININNRRSLRSLRISKCSKLKVLDMPLEEIADLYVDCPDLNQFSNLGGQRDLTLGGPISSKVLSSIPMTLSTLQSIHLECFFPRDFDFSIFQYTRKVNLVVHYSDHQTPLCAFPVFHGEELSLTRFNIDSWNQASFTFKKLVVLKLINCEGLGDLPVMSELRELEVGRCRSLKTIPTLMNLKVLKIEDAPNLVSIAPSQPALRELKLTNLPSLAKLSFESTSLQSISLDLCPLLTDIVQFKNCSFIEVIYCDGITSVAGLSGSSLEDDQRQISLRRLINVSDFARLCHINQLDLYDIPSLISLEGIHHINHLTISNCMIQDTRGLRSIGRLSLLSCFRLERLVGIEDIPEVHISHCTFLHMWEELRDHEVVKVRDQRIFPYLKDRQREMNIKTLIGVDSKWKEVTYTLD